MSQGLEHSLTSWSGQALKHEASWIDAVDARVRILCSAFFALVVVSSPHFLPVLLGLFIALFLVKISRLNIKRALRRVVAMDLFMLTLICVLPFTTPGDAMFSVFGLSASWQGLAHALLITFKANAVLLVLFSLVATMSASTLGHALAHLKVPDKLVHLLLFMVRYLDVISDEYKKMRRAMQARAFVMQTNRHTWKSMGYLFGMLLIRSIERAERIANAMKCRGFCGRFYLNDELKLNRIDRQFSAFFICFLVLLIGLNF
ncbi:cobalt ECF transporter T component CbiQ [Psychromonas sp. psych-6C06]|uniref:cobalt ECF transporter T component CbiQ n=1 Tax=Psychromonas sp. psych-6C06 TaxID=2058089 RepID=UPI000C34763F|nr:cobalt ECF transporter T component CbiQ [Psychromonas sp. psych-6C06]PKF61592.1 cobalt ECF transporter T component CbiQ [Psychromonas sp. psych-6C06]